METKLCECGCGTVIQAFDKWLNRPRRFANGHNRRGEAHHNWNGGKTIDGCGYVLVKYPKHPRANKKGYVREHILVLEKSLGRCIKAEEAPHHIDGDKKNNAIGNLMLFAAHSMHNAYEQRLKAFSECGHYDWRKCCYCHQWDDPKNLTTHSKRGVCHKKCRVKYVTEWKQKGQLEAELKNKLSEALILLRSE